MGLLDAFKRRKKAAKSGLPEGSSSATASSPARSPLQAATKGGKSTAPAFPRFQTTAGDQVDRGHSDPFATARLKLRVAFTPSQPVADSSRFAGRREIVTALIRAIEDQRLHAVLYGDRGIGKTSILHVLAQAAREARYLVIYLSCGAGSTFDEVFRSIAVDVPLLYHIGYGPTSVEAERGDTFASLLPAGPVTVRMAAELSAKLVGTRVLILLDEFDRAESAEFRRNIAEFLKSLSDRAGRAQLAIAGVASNLTEMLAEIPAIQRNIFALEVPRMGIDELQQLVKQGSSLGGLTFDDTAIEFIVQAANGLPYLASLLSQDAGLAALGDHRLRVTSDDASAAIVQVLADLSARMSRDSQMRVAQLVREGAYRTLGLLAGVAHVSNGVISATDLETIVAGSEVQRCRAVLDILGAEGAVVEIEDGVFGRQYRFLDPSVPQYLWLRAVQSRFVNRLTRHGASLAAVGATHEPSAAAAQHS